MPRIMLKIVYAASCKRLPFSSITMFSCMNDEKVVNPPQKPVARRSCMFVSADVSRLKMP